jgi:hypothetical protein
VAFGSPIIRELWSEKIPQLLSDPETKDNIQYSVKMEYS